MDASEVVEADDVVGNVGFCLGVVSILVLPDALHFEVKEEAFGHGIIPPVSFLAHAAHEVVFSQQILVGLTGLLAAAVP
jgi:hypothetical protein